MSTTVVDAAWRRADARAERAGLALGTWMVLLAADVAVGRPVVGEMLLDDLGIARVRVARIGTSVNAMAATENGGDTVPDAEMAKVLDSLGVRVGAASEAVRNAGAAFAGTDLGWWSAAVQGPGPGPAGQGSDGSGAADPGADDAGGAGPAGCRSRA